MLQDSLQEIGLTKGESDVYLTLVKLGLTTTGNLIKKSSVSRSKVYDVLERLKTKGFATEIVKNGIRHFEATSPSRIIDYLQKAKETAETKLDSAQHLVAQLNTYSKSTDPSEAKIFSGIEGVKSFYKEILSTMTKDDEYLAITIASTVWTKEMQQFFQNFHLNRAQLSCRAKILFSGSKKNLPTNSDLTYTGLYTLKITDNKLPSGIAIFGDCVGLLSWGNTPTIFVIYSKTQAKQYRDFFYEIWNKSNTNM